MDGDQSAAGLQKQALAHLAAGRAEEARVLLERAIQLGPEGAGCHANLGVALQALGRLDEATAAYGRAIGIVSGQLGVLHYNQGTALAAAGRLEEAAAAYRQALGCRPGWAVALDNLGTALHRLGRAEEAEQAYAEALVADPNHVDARYNLGTLLHARGRHREAEALFRQVVTARAGFAPAHAGLGAALAGQGRAEEALAALRRAIELDGTLVGPHQHLAEVLAGLGEHEQALAAADRAVALGPHDPSGHALRGASLLALQRVEEAVAAYRRARALAPHLPELHVNAGIALVQVGDLEGAVAAYRQALALDPAHVPALAGLASALGRLGRVDEAVAAYRRLLEIDPEHPQAPHLLAALRGETTAAAPRTYVSKLFDGYAAQFDEHMRSKLEYRVPALVREVLIGTGVDRFGRALDLGCGTGLVGAVLRPWVDELHGVDLSEQMVERARQKNLYDRLEVAEIVEHLGAAAEPRYHLVVAGDVLCYFGDLAPVLTGVRARLEPGGLFVFTVERLDDGDVTLRASGRYAHGRDYLVEQATRAGFQVLSCDGAELRRETEQGVAGWVCALENE